MTDKIELSPAMILKHLMPMSAIIGCIEALKAGQVVTEEYLERMQSYYIPELRESQEYFKQLITRAPDQRDADIRMLREVMQELLCGVGACKTSLGQTVIECSVGRKAVTALAATARYERKSS